ncbi:MAG TPA: hypothetical protein VEY33_09440 [Gemmatimonadota bacterium]|nr:hypothetical protein [Gemmatimonadota bacterium]
MVGIAAAGFCVALAAFVPTAAAQSWPFRTEDPRLVTTGALAAHIALEVGADREYTASGLSGTVLRAPVAIRFGFGRAEFEVDGGYEVLSIDRRSPAPLDSMLDVSGDRTHDVIDPVIGLKVRISDEAAGFPAWSFKVATRLPAAGNESGLGLDTTDFWLWLLAGKSVGPARVAANVGAGVLGIPTRGDRQNDVWGYGLSIVGPLREGWEVGAEVQGSFDVRGDTPIGTEERGQARLGVRRTAGWIALDAALILGIEDLDPDLGAVVGVAMTFFGAFEP